MPPSDNDPGNRRAAREATRDRAALVVDPALVRSRDVDALRRWSRDDPARQRLVALALLRDGYRVRWVISDGEEMPLRAEDGWDVLHEPTYARQWLPHPIHTPLLRDPVRLWGFACDCLDRLHPAHLRENPGDALFGEAVAATRAWIKRGADREDCAEVEQALPPVWLERPPPNLTR